MFFLITIFYVSLAGIILMLCAKAYHLWTEKDLFFHGLVRKLDYILKQKSRDWKLVFGAQKAAAQSKMKVFLHVTLKLWIARLWAYVGGYYEDFSNYVKGRQLLRHGGAVSFYLKDIAKFKHHLSARNEIK